MHAHIRRANPRGELPVVYSPNSGLPTTAVSRRIPIARRGIPYGHRLDDPCNPDVPLEDRPQDGVGMLFMSMHSDIARQFEYVQRHWLGGAGTSGTIDPVVVDPISSGRAPSQPQKWPVEWARPHDGTVSFAFNSCVKLLGGEYFFLPPKSFLELI
jgi:deferrochelatase/peroxidase EfeB